VSFGAVGRFCLATVLSFVALYVLLLLYYFLAYGNESGNAVAILLIAVTLVAMILSVIGIFLLLWVMPNRRRQVDH
jgi:heme/copper-type cytochrome/quinol oxidase subunit 4